MKIVSVVIAALITSANASPCSKLNANKKTALAFLDGLFNKRDPAVIDKYVGATYAQHNPTAADGAAALKAGLPALGNSTKVEFGDVVASGNLVWVNTRYSGFPNMSTSVGLDVLRLDNGKIVEHWDVLQTEIPADKTASGRPMFPTRRTTPVRLEGCDTTSEAQLAVNKKVALAFIDGVFGKHDPAAVDKYVGITYAQHNPFAPDGPDVLRSLISQMTNATTVKFGAVAAVGDLIRVNVHYTGVPGVPTSVGLDGMRFERGKIVEHWDILQPEVLNTVSGRPMFPITE